MFSPEGTRENVCRVHNERNEHEKSMHRCKDRSGGRCDSYVICVTSVALRALRCMETPLSVKQIEV